MMHGDRETSMRAEAWRRFRIAFPQGSIDAFERAWPALRDGISLEMMRRSSDEERALPMAA